VRIAVIAPPFIAVPPGRYGGTELFVAALAEYLHRRGHHVVVYANGASTVSCEVRWFYADPEWPLIDPAAAVYKNLNHLAWALSECRGESDIIHLNDSFGVPLTRLTSGAPVLTMHHPHDDALTSMYLEHPEVQYVAISHAQADVEPLAGLEVIHHGIDPSLYDFSDEKDEYLTFLGRIAPLKGTHLAIEVSKRTGLPLKIAGEIQPAFRDYWDTAVRPHVDGRQIEYVGEVDHRAKNALLSRSAALLFPIQWDEPFGLAMIEAMACGTPVLALGQGSVREIIRDGVTGRICNDVDALADAARKIGITPAACREAVEDRFSLDRMGRDYERLYERLLGGPNTRPPDRAVGANGSSRSVRDIR
jgi:glycosyltransferase involved in cell wall biosynthesis